MTISTVQGAMSIRSTNARHPVTGSRVERILMSQEFATLYSLVDNSIAENQLPHTVMLDIYETNVNHKPEEIVKQVQELRKVLHQHNLAMSWCSIRADDEKIYVTKI